MNVIGIHGIAETGFIVNSENTLRMDAILRNNGQSRPDPDTTADSGRVVSGSQELKVACNVVASCIERIGDGSSCSTNFCRDNGRNSETQESE
jgi:hypothetical protein